MKKLSVLFIIGIISLASTVKAGVPDYIVTEEGVKFYERVRYGITANIVGVSESGRDCYAANEVIAYRRNGRIYERMPVIRDNSETGRYDFMEVMAYRCGMKVYRHNIPAGLNMPDNNEYLVFRDGKFVVRFDEKNIKTLNEFFFTNNSLASK